MAPSPRTLSPEELALLVIIALSTFLYSVFVLATPLAWVESIAVVVLLYLFWRLVRAVERIAAAMNADSDSSSAETASE